MHCLLLVIDRIWVFLQNNSQLLQLLLLLSILYSFSSLFRNHRLAASSVNAIPRFVWASLSLLGRIRGLSVRSQALPLQ